MSDKVELKVNVINQLKLLRQSTFKDILCFLDEDIQNAQRAKAKEVRVSISVGNGKVIIENDGAILDNPQSLFSIAESGWDNETKETENPFGMGFFSNITVSNLIEVYSGDKHITFDVNKMISTNNTEIDVEAIEDEEDYVYGFRLVLNNFDFKTASSWNIEERVKQLGKYIQELDIYYNDNLQEKKDLTEGDDSYFQVKIDDEDCKGWISLVNGCWWSDNLNIFYKGRLVRKLENTPYLNGDIHISDKTLNLTSPDRKDIIKDEKYNKFNQKIRSYAKQLCEDALLNGDEGEVENLAESIGRYIDKSKIKNKIKFLTLKDGGNKDLEYIKEIALIKRKNRDIRNFKDYQLYLEEDSNQFENDHDNEIEIEVETTNEVPEAKGTVVHEGSSSYSEGYVEKPKVKKEDVEEKEGELIINNEEPVFWMGFSEIELNEYKYNMLKHYGLKLIIARNKVEEEILKHMKESDNVLHISELEEDVRVKGTLSNTVLNIKEQRALMLFDLISRILGFNHNIFSIGDLMVTKVVNVKSINKSNELIEESIAVLRNGATEKIYVDRSIIDTSDLVDSVDTEITIKDYKFILTNLSNIVEQVYLICNSKKGKDGVMEDIILALGQGVL